MMQWFLFFVIIQNNSMENLKFHASIGDKIFRPIRTLNVALFESCMYGLSKRLASNHEISNQEVKNCYNKLLNHKEFASLISQSTTNINNVRQRMSIAKNTFCVE